MDNSKSEQHPSSFSQFTNTELAELRDRLSYLGATRQLADKYVVALVTELYKYEAVRNVSKIDTVTDKRVLLKESSKDAEGTTIEYYPPYLDRAKSKRNYL